MKKAEGFSMWELLRIVLTSPVWILGICLMALIFIFIYPVYHCWYNLTCRDGVEMFQRMVKVKEM